MDPEFGRVDREDALRSIFHRTGHHQAPADMEHRVLAALAMADARVQEDAPLIPRRAWMLIALLLGALVAGGLVLANGTTATSGRPWLEVPDWLDFRILVDLASSKWTIAAVASGLALITMDRLLTSRLRSFLLA